MKALSSIDVVKLQLTQLIHTQLVDDGHTKYEIERIIERIAYDIVANANKLEFFQTYYIQGYCNAILPSITLEQAHEARGLLSHMIWRVADKYL